MVSVFVGDDSEKIKIAEEFFSNKTSEDIVHEYINSRYYHKYKLHDMLRTDYTNKKYLDEALECNPNATQSRQKIWDDNYQFVLEGYINNYDQDRVRTITTKQDRHPNSGNLFFDKGGEGKSLFRYLTPRECLMLMGFTEEDYERIIINNPAHHNTTLFPRDKIIRMAGNSIPVKLLEGIFLQIKKFDSCL